MPNDIVQNIFSDTVLNVVRTLLLAAVPDEWDWIPATVLTIVSVVDDIDAIDYDELTGADKMDAVVDVVVNTLDEVDDIPGWADLPEEARDGLIKGVAEIAVFAIRASESSGLPALDVQVRFADALRELTLAIFELVESFQPRERPTPALAAVNDAVRNVLEARVEDLS